MCKNFVEINVYELNNGFIVETNRFYDHTFFYITCEDNCIKDEMFTIPTCSEEQEEAMILHNIDESMLEYASKYCDEDQYEELLAAKENDSEKIAIVKKYKKTIVVVEFENDFMVEIDRGEKFTEFYITHKFHTEKVYMFNCPNCDEEQEELLILDNLTKYMLAFAEECGDEDLQEELLEEFGEDDDYEEE